MSGIAKRTEIRIVRRHDERPSAGPQQPVELFHRADHVRHMLNHMDRAHFAKCAVPERKRKVIQVRNHIGAGVRIAV